VMETKRRNKAAVNVTPAQRVSDFGKEQFCVEGGVLWCKVCDVPVDHVRRQTVADHVQSAKHRSRNNKRQANFDDASQAPKRQATTLDNENFASLTVLGVPYRIFTADHENQQLNCVSRTVFLKSPIFVSSDHILSILTFC